MMEQSTEKRQELLYKIMIPTIIRKLPFSAKLQENKEDCVSTNLTVAVHNKITSHIITSNKVDKITCKRLNTHVTNFHYVTHPGLEIYYISKKLQHNPLDKKESSLLLLTQYNISYHDIQKAQGERKKAIASSKKSTTNSKAKIQLNYKFATQKANVKNFLQQQKKFTSSTKTSN